MKASQHYGLLQTFKNFNVNSVMQDTAPRKMATCRSLIITCRHDKSLSIEGPLTLMKHSLLCASRARLAPRRRHRLPDGLLRKLTLVSSLLSASSRKTTSFAGSEPLLRENSVSNGTD